MKNQEAVIARLKGLKKLGVLLAIDDFGTGYSSLSYLKRFPIDTLKIDQSFVRNIPENPDDSAIAEMIIGLSSQLKFNVVAEGVETKEQLTFLQTHGCDFGQGYFFSKPVPAEKLTMLLMKTSGTFSVDKNVMA
jgi:EAL domain-containing protein (putative c-di-GMP-specific phosphodiesterase class I)